MAETNQLLPVSEADIKRAISDYLQIGMNQGKWFFMRLNAGSFILQNSDGSYRRRIQGVAKGTADFVVFQSYEGDAPICCVSFIEVKKPEGGKQSEAQKEFEEKVTKFHAQYYIVKSVEELQEALQ